MTVEAVMAPGTAAAVRGGGGGGPGNGGGGGGLPGGGIDTRGGGTGGGADQGGDRPGGGIDARGGRPSGASDEGGDQPAGGADEGGDRRGGGGDGRGGGPGDYYEVVVPQKSAADLLSIYAHDHGRAAGPLVGGICLPDARIASPCRPPRFGHFACRPLLRAAPVRNGGLHCVKVSAGFLLLLLSRVLELVHARRRSVCFWFTWRNFAVDVVKVVTGAGFPPPRIPSSRPKSSEVDTDDNQCSNFGVRNGLLTRTAGLKTLTDYLVHMHRFVMKAGWVPKKLDVYVDVCLAGTICISPICSRGIQPGEEMLADGAPGYKNDEPVPPVASKNTVPQLASMEFNYLHCQKAAVNTSNTGVEVMNWLLSDMDDPDIDDLISKYSEQSVDESGVQTLVPFGFQKDVAMKALKASGGIDWSSTSVDSSTSIVKANNQTYKMEVANTS